MRAKVKWLIIALVLLATAGILLVGSIGFNGQKPEIRLSWQEQLAHVQKAVTKVDPDAGLYRIYGAMFYDEKDSLGKNGPDEPSPVTQVLFTFYGKEPYKIYIGLF